jgi:ABC-type phosphate transport system substrate-binding protein
MTSFSLRRLVPALVVAGAAVAALTAPGTASAASDLGQQCSGSNTKGQGSTFQAPLQEKWNVNFNVVKNVFACAGLEGQGSLGKPTVTYLHTGTNAGSGACLKGWGAEKSSKAEFAEFGFCGTDEAPNEKQKEEIENNKSGGESKALETFPVAQGAVAIIVNLPEGCKSKSILVAGTVEKPIKDKLGRLSLTAKSVEGVYRGTVKTWKQLIEAQEGNIQEDKLECTKNGENEGENAPIIPVVRLDKSGTTHIFKIWLEQVNDTSFEAEAGVGCNSAAPEEPRTWTEVAIACENVRWPSAAHVVRGTENGNPGVVKRVEEKQGSIGYADLAVARQEKEFSEKGKGGEQVKGTETKQGEQSKKYWALLQNTETITGSGFKDPSSDGDVTKAANSNCAGTVYTDKAGEVFPPKSTRESWAPAKAVWHEKQYGICGLTYDLALRQAKFFPGTTKEEATTVRDYIRWATKSTVEGGSAEIKGSDYEKLPSATVTEEVEDGLEELGFETAGVAK